MKKIAFIDDCVEDPSNPDPKYLNAKMLKENNRYAIIRHKEDLKIIGDLRKHHDVKTYNGLWYATQELSKHDEAFDYIITNCPPYNMGVYLRGWLFADYYRSLGCLSELNKKPDSEIIVFSRAPDFVFERLMAMNIHNLLRRGFTCELEDNIEQLLGMIK